MRTTPLVDREAFRAVHRHERRSRAFAAIGAFVSVAAVVLFGWVMPGRAAPAAGAGPQPPAAQPVLAAGAVVPGASGASVAPVVPGVPAAPAAGQQPGNAQAAPPVTASAPPQGLPTLAPAAATGASSTPAAPAAPPGPARAVLRIDVGATGYQAEIDRCLWVRMDLGGVAPIVAAHDYCGGSVVLGLNPGDRVTMTGQHLDGDYVVTGSRDARPGQDAAAATAGLVAKAILQTCYPDGVRVRLVTLVAAGAPGPAPATR